MLIEQVYLLVLLLITVSWASLIVDGEEINVNFPRLTEDLIEEALNTPEISSQLTFSSHAILSSIVTKNEYFRPFYDLAAQNYDISDFEFDSKDPKYWNAYMNHLFRDLSRQQPNQAQVIIKEIIIPHHPFLSQVSFTFQTDNFLNHFILDIDMYLDQVAKNIFFERYSQILILEDPSEAQILLKALLRKAKYTTFHDSDPEFKYHYAFIETVPFEYFKRTKYCNPDDHVNINSLISKLAPVLYREIAEDSKRLADKILDGLLPSIYSTLTDTSYENTIRKYQESSLQPIDKSYLWDPQQFHSDLLEAFQSLRIVENYNLPPYLKILEFLSGDSALAHLFRHYIAQNYCKPSNIHTQNQPLFWRSLIFSSISVFSSLFPHYSSQIINQLQSLPFFNEVQYLFVYGLLDHQFFSKNHFPLVSSWGHTPTVKLLLQRRTDIETDHMDQSLASATEGGHTVIVEFLLQHHTDIGAVCVVRAFERAVEAGYAPIVDLLLQNRIYISSEHIGWALKSAAEGGHTHIVDILLQYHTVIASDLFDQALYNAARYGHSHVVELLLQHLTNISDDHVRLALLCAAEGGHISLIQVLFQIIPNIAADDLDQALYNANECGHTHIVDLLRRYQLNENEIH
jgi:hypothetical protein